MRKLLSHCIAASVLGMGLALGTVAKAEPRYVIIHKVNQTTTVVTRGLTWAHQPTTPEYPDCYGALAADEESLDRYFSSNDYASSDGLELDLWYNESGAGHINNYGADQTMFDNSAMAGGRWIVSHEPCDDRHHYFTGWLTHLKSKLDTTNIMNRVKMVFLDIKNPRNSTGGYDPVMDIKTEIQAVLGVLANQIVWVYSTANPPDRAFFTDAFLQTVRHNELVGMDEGSTCSHPDVTALKNNAYARYIYAAKDSTLTNCAGIDFSGYWTYDSGSQSAGDDAINSGHNLLMFENTSETGSAVGINRAAALRPAADKPNFKDFPWVASLPADKPDDPYDSYTKWFPSSGGPTNYARQAGVTATQSSTYGSYVASYAIDGNTETLAHTNNASGSYLEINLGVDRAVGDVVIANRMEECVVCASRLSGASVALYNAVGSVVATKVLGAMAYLPTMRVNFATTSSETVSGVRKVRITVSGSNYLNVYEVGVFGFDGNIARGKTATMSSIFSTPANVAASRGNDGIRNGLDQMNANDPDYFHTNCEVGNWWNVKIGVGVARQISSVKIYNRRKGSNTTINRLNGARLDVYNGATLAYTTTIAQSPNSTLTTLSLPVLYATDVRIVQPTATCLHLAEVEVY